MYKTRNTGTGNGMRGTRGMGRMLYNPGNVAKHSGEFHQIFWGMSPNMSGNVTKHSGECHQIFWGMSPNIPANVAKYSGERRNIPGNVANFGVKGRVAFRILSNIHDGALLRK